MLHSSCNLWNIIRNVTCRYHADQSCIFHIGLSKRHASILIMPKYDTRYKVHMFINPQKIVANKNILQYKNYRWIYITSFLSDDTKNEDKSEKKLIEEVQQRIIELNEQKLGKLKERVLNIESTVNRKEEEKTEATKLAAKQSAESKESPKDDSMSKKGTTLYMDLHS